MENTLGRQIFEEMPGYGTAQDRELRIIAANRAFRRDFGDDAVGRYCFEAYKHRNEPCPVCPVAQTFEDGQVHSSEEIVQRRDGEQVNVIVYAAPIRNGANEIVAAVEVSTDITGVKQLQEEFRTLFDQVPCYISVQDRNLRLLEANRRFKSAFGDEIGAPCYQVYKHRTEPCEVCSVAKTFQDGQIHQSEEVVTTLDGRQENVLVRTAPLHGPLGEIIRVMEMSTNITELRQLQSRLASLGLLVGSVSHGIKGLLSALDGGIYLMETGFKKDKQDRVQQGFEIIRRNLERMRGMVMNVLYYAKDREMLWQPIDLREIVSSVAQVLTSRARQLGVELKVQLPPDSGAFEGDHNAVHAMLVNLMENSLDACRLDSAKQQHTVALDASLDGHGVVFTIADNGIGMDQETRDKAFSLFFSSKGAEGTGLGLFVAHKIIVSHGGSIELESEPGRGTQFVVRLPRVRPPATGNGTDKEDEPPILEQP